MPVFKMEQISGPMACGEGPHWDSKRKVLYLVDIPKSLIFKYDPATNKINQAKVDAPSVGFILPVSGTTDKFVVGIGLSLAVITWDGESKTVPQKNIEILFSVESDKPTNRFNDGKTDPRGRVFAGTMGTQIINGVFEQKKGNLYSFSKDRKLKLQIPNIGIANGLAWTEDHKIFYYIDSLAYNIYAYDYDIATGTISNQRIVFDLKKNGIPGVADGQTIDRNGNLWVALYGGNMVINVDPRQGKVIRKLPMPGRDITSVAFAGENLDELIVTSAYQDLPEGETDLIPYVGSTYRITGLGVRGYEGVPAVI